MKYIAVFSIVLFTACSSTGVVPMDKGTYMIGKRSVQIGFGPPSGVKADVYKEANEFCAQKQKMVKTLNLEVTNSAFAKPGHISLEFQCE